MASKAVLTYLQSQNRPYSANDIVQNLDKEHGKTAVQKALDDLTSQKMIMEKVYGKQKVYCVIQEDDTLNSEQNRVLVSKMDRSIIELSDSLNKSEQSIKNAEFELKNLLNSLTTEQAKVERDKLQKKFDEMKEKLTNLKENTVPISNEQKVKIEENHTKYMKEFRKRRRICVDILDSILEGYPKTKKHLIEEIGIETDEAVGCTLGK